MVPPDSDRVPPAPPYSGYCQVRARFAYGALTLCGPPSHAGSAARAASLSAALQPRARLDAPGLGWPPFARRYSGGHCCSPFLRLLGCFGSAGSPPQSCGCRASRAAGCPIRVPPDPWPLAPPRRVSPPAAPFVASVSHRHPPCALIHSLAAHRIAAAVARPRSPSSSVRAPRARCLSSILVSLSSLCSVTRGIPRVTLIFRILSMNRPRPSPGLRVEDVGLEPTTPGLQSLCSSRLSQSPRHRRAGA